MKTDDLIQRLGADARPVRPLAPPWQRASTWLAAAVGYVLLVGVASWIWRGSLAGISAEPAYVIQQLALVVVAIVAADAAFASVIPGALRPRLWVLLTPAAVLMATLAWGILADIRTLGIVGLGREIDWPCVRSIVAGAAILWASATALLKRGAALSPSISGLLAGLAAVSVANVEACLTRAHAFSVTVLIWHGLTSLVVIMVAVVLSRRVLVWPQPRQDFS